MYANDLYSEHGQLRRPLAWSLGLHVAFAVFVVLYAVFINGFAGSGWGSGGGGDAMGATLVSSVPLPANPTADNKCARNGIQGTVEIAAHGSGEGTGRDSDSRQEHENQDKTRARQNAQPNASRNPNSPRRIRFLMAKVVRSAAPTPCSAGGAKGGFGFTGSGGDFGSRYSWYVQAVQRKVTENWLKYEVDPSITEASRVYLTFDIARDGHPSNVQIEQPSEVPSLDQSGVTGAPAHRYFRPAAAGLFGQQSVGRVLVRLQKVSQSLVVGR